MKINNLFSIRMRINCSTNHVMLEIQVLHQTMRQTQDYPFRTTIVIIVILLPRESNIQQGSNLQAMLLILEVFLEYRVRIFS